MRRCRWKEIENDYSCNDECNADACHKIEFLPEKYSFFKAVGCDQCGQTGYMGREMISEILPITDRMQSLIANGGSKDEMRILAKEEGFIDMFEDGVIRAARGVTSIEEIYRVAKQWKNN